MTLTPGTRLGSYEIVGPLGAGGMGEVYRASDLKLHRQVAIKILPSELSRDAERVQRFRREARVLASLNHPGIAAIYELGESEESWFLILELVEGETLAERIARGPIPVAEASMVARQIAEAVEAAHDRGIVHRDLKPSNIKITPEGRVKVLDFGLAKALATEEPAELEAPTITRHGTEAGAVLGTPVYMSPEQARGRAVDKRTDVWAFGCVFYEMLTGRQAFAGPTAPDALAAILERDPDWAALPRDATPGIRWLLGRCLDKDPRRRLRDIGEARVELENPGTVIFGASNAATREERTLLPRFLWPLIAAVVSAAIVAAVLSRREAPPAPVRRATLLLPPDQSIVTEPAEGPAQYSLALSPDGKYLVYGAAVDGTAQLFVRALDEFDARVLPGTRDANYPVFSPDGRWIAFFASGRLRKVRVTGESPLAICEVPHINRGASWGPDGTIVFSAGSGSAALWRVSGDGGPPERLTAPAGDGPSHTWPHILPDGDTVIFSMGDAGQEGLGILSLRTREWKPLLATEAKQAFFIPTGHLVYAVNNVRAIRAVPFDLETRKITGSPLPLLDGVFDASAAGGTYFAVSRSGTLVYLPGGVDYRLVWVDRFGRVTPWTVEEKGYRFPALSPDETQVAVTVDPDQGNSDIWIYDVSRETGRPLTADDNHEIYPIWTPDGSRVAFFRNGHVSWQPADGSTEPAPLFTGAGSPTPCAFSSDGRFLLYSSRDPETGWDVWAAPVEGTGPPLSISKTAFRETVCDISPDDRWVAFESDVSGRAEVYLRPFVEPGSPVQISRAGGSNPVWSGNGKELFYRNHSQIFAVSIESGASFRGGESTLLFDNGSLMGSAGARRFDVTRDGQRFVMIQDPNRVQGTELRVVFNWFEELGR